MSYSKLAKYNAVTAIKAIMHNKQELNSIIIYK